MNILFVCTGNTCRSPMAEALLKSKKKDVEVRSAGIFAGAGQPLSQGSAEVLKEIDLELDHTSTPMDGELLQWADVVLTMTEHHKQTLALQYPDQQDKFFTLKEYVFMEDEQWETLKGLYSALEEKRVKIMKEAGDELTEDELDRHLRMQLKDEISHIQEIENNLPDFNISDPFGGSTDVYRNTRKELERCIDLLAKKLDNRSD